MRIIQRNTGYTLKIIDETAPPDCILCHRRNDTFKDIAQHRLTRKACIQYLGRIPRINEQFNLPFYQPGNPCTRVA